VVAEEEAGSKRFGEQGSQVGRRIADSIRQVD